MRFAAVILVCVALVSPRAQTLSWKPFRDYRAAPLDVPLEGKTGFQLANATKIGIDFTNQLSQARSLTNQVFLNGSGLAAGDIDGDGWCDLYFCGLDNRNELYRNRGGWNFENITDSAGVACAGQASTGTAFADIDGDGDLDLLINGIARGTRLFLNDGAAHFQEVTDTMGLGGNMGSTSLAIADLNRDGFLDLYAVNYRSSTFRDEPEKRFRAANRNGQYEIAAVDGRPVTDPDLAGRFTIDPILGLLEHGEPDALFINEAGKKFRRVQWTDGTFLDESGAPMTVPYDWGLSAMFRDLNADGAPDLYVCNDFQSPDRIWLSDGAGHFRGAPASAFRQTSLFSMGVDFADLDGDGREEIFVADMLSRKHARRQTQLMEGMGALAATTKFDPRPQVSRNTLFWNRGDGTYAEVAQLAGLEATEWSWSPVFLDVDLDGRRDLIVTTGHERDAQHIDIARQIDQARKQKLSWREQIELRRRFPKLESPILAFRNQGGLRFTEATSDWGFSTAQISQGIALADLDNDGDLDLAVNCLNSGALIYRNESTQNRIALRLAGNPPNTRGVGAKIVVRADGLPLQTDEMAAGGRYLSSDDFIRTFAVKNNAEIEVSWPDGRRSFVRNARANFVYEISEQNALPGIANAGSNPPTLFEDVSAALNHTHKDEPFDDFQRQPLLPRKFSEAGPGVCWFDLDGDGWEDLLIGSGRSGALAFFKNARGQLLPAKLPQISAPTRRDQAGILGWLQGTNHSLLMSFSNYEDAQTTGPSVIAFEPGAGAISSVLPALASSTGALALGDADADGDLDLFVAGQIISARYPEAPSSTFLRNDGGSFHAAPAMNELFRNVGLVNAALWSDLTADGAPELLLALEGGPIRVFTLEQGRFRERTRDLGLEQFAGWWLSVTTGDFNNDGRMDIVAGNLGRNSKYERFLADGYHLYFGDFEADGRMQLLEAVHDHDSGKIVPIMDRDSVAMGLPDLHQRYPTFASFSTASVEEILGSRARRARVLRVNTSQSLLFVNEGNRFRAQPLPLQAQFAPVFGLAVGDLDADGNEDLFLTQNLFSVGQRTSRYDAGEGSLLLGDGSGGFRPLPASVSGIKMQAEGRGAAFCDYDHDGRLDLVAAQNSAETKLYRNNTAKPGLRISLNGGALNPHAIGAQVRLRFAGGGAGPAHEIHAGEGYWSQASRTIVLGKPREAEAVEVFWPGGKRDRFPVPKDALEFTLPERN